MPVLLTFMTHNDKVPELTGKEFDDFTREGVVLVDFFAEWCMPCIMMAPVIDEISDKFKGKAKVGKVNVDENQALAQKYGVSSIPNFVVLKDGEIVEQFVGSVSEEELEEKIEKHL